MLKREGDKSLKRNVQEIQDVCMLMQEILILHERGKSNRRSGLEQKRDFHTYYTIRNVGNSSIALAGRRM